MYSLLSVIFSLLALCASLSLTVPVSGHPRPDTSVLAVDDMRISSGTLLASIPQRLSGVHTSQWLMLLEALALGATGLSMVLMSERRPQLRANGNAGFRESEASSPASPTLVIRDLDDRIVDWSNGAQRFYGFSRQEALGRILDDELKSVYPK